MYWKPNASFEITSFYAAAVDYGNTKKINKKIKRKISKKKKRKRETEEQTTRIDFNSFV